MRLWHQELITKLPNAQLLGQHRECCALRGLGWGRKHATVDYVFTHEPARLYLYHSRVMREMCKRGYKVDSSWFNPWYRGKRCRPWKFEVFPQITWGTYFYPEHNDEYMQECLENLQRKGVQIA